MPISRTKADALSWIPKIAEAALADDRHRLETVLVTAIRALRQVDPSVSEQLGKLLASHVSPSTAFRSKTRSPPPPTESDEGMSLVRVTDVTDVLPPMLSDDVAESARQFVEERRASERLLSAGVRPPASVLLVGPPGTGKTMFAHWLAAELGLPLVAQDLATSISSLLGKTGFNLRRTLDYARSHPCLLLLDEFDAIAKRRDDRTELGELKRIVNVLLKELEEWPIKSVLVAATNHPELLDPAVQRRFNVTLSLALPESAQREAILRRVLGRFAEGQPDGVIVALVEALDGKSGSDVERIAQSAVRRHISAATPVIIALVREIVAAGDGKAASIANLARSLQRAPGAKLTVRELAALLGKSATTIQYHLTKKGADDGKEP